MVRKTVEEVKEQVKNGTLKEQADVTLTRSQPSVMVKRDGKGVYTYEVKAYADDLGEALDEAVAAMEKLDDLLARRTPGRDL